MRASLILTTYNWKEALTRALASIAAQSRLPDEVIVADDGSAPDTFEMLLDTARSFPAPLRHVWQEDSGFRAARARNRAIAASRGEYVVMVDGDMILHRHFMIDHLTNARTGHWLQGARLQATSALTARLLAGEPARFHPWIDADFGARHASKRRHAVRLPWLARRKVRGAHGGVTVMSCNMSAWRGDLLRVNGFDERFCGYGGEDLGLDARLHHAGVKRSRLVHAALAIHLAHRSRSSGDVDDPAAPNNRILTQTLREHATRCALGIDQHLAEFQAQPALDLREITSK